MSCPEPTDVWPEKQFQAAVVSALKHFLQERNQKFVVLEQFGLDIALFFSAGSETIVRLFEVKSFGAQRAGGVGFGDGRGAGSQVDLLLLSNECSPILSDITRWLYVDATQPAGTKRYALFTCDAAKAAAMGGVARGKQNNLRVSAIRDHLVDWNEFCILLQRFAFPASRIATTA